MAALYIKHFQEMARKGRLIHLGACRRHQAPHGFSCRKRSWQMPGKEQQEKVLAAGAEHLDMRNLVGMRPGAHGAHGAHRAEPALPALGSAMKFRYGIQTWNSHTEPVCRDLTCPSSAWRCVPPRGTQSELQEVSKYTPRGFRTADTFPGAGGTEHLGEEALLCVCHAEGQALSVPTPPLPDPTLGMAAGRDRPLTRRDASTDPSVTWLGWARGQSHPCGGTALRTPHHCPEHP